MAGDDGIIHLDYSGVERAVEDFQAQTNQIANTISELNSNLRPLQESWIGEDKDVYTGVQQRWNQAVDNLRQLLSNNATLLEDISANYRHTERTGAQRWGDITVGR